MGIHTIYIKSRYDAQSEVYCPLHVVNLSICPESNPPNLHHKLLSIPPQSHAFVKLEKI